MRILVVEDEPKAAQFIKQGLEEYEHKVDVAYDGQMGKKLALRGKYDIIILDIILPYINGLTVAKEIRKTSNVPILMLSALGNTEDKIAGFDHGSDEYMVKPFAFAELLARINLIVKRKGVMTPPPVNIKIGNLILNTDDKTASRDGNTIILTTKEYHLLLYMMNNHGKVITRNEIAKEVWEAQFETPTNVIDVYVSFLRKKIDKDYPTKFIHSQVGMGYIFKEE